MWSDMSSAIMPVDEISIMKADRETTKKGGRDEQLGEWYVCHSRTIFRSTAPIGILHALKACFAHYRYAARAQGVIRALEAQILYPQKRSDNNYSVLLIYYYIFLDINYNFSVFVFVCSLG